MSRASLVRAPRVPDLLTKTCPVCHEGEWFTGLKQTEHSWVVVVVANVYTGKRWRRTEYFHRDHYDNRYGEPAPVKKIRRAA